MRRSSVKKLSAWIAAVGACIALGGGSVLLSAQGARAKSPQVAQTRKAAPKPAARPSGKRAGAKKPGTLRTKGAPQVGISGVVTDGSGAGWPLYSRLEFTSDMTEPFVIFTDPVTGAYADQLFDGVEYSVAITAVGPGYVPADRTVTTSGAPIDLDVALAVNAVVCNAPGYTAGTFTPVMTEGFDAGTLPAGWSVVNNSQDGGGPWEFFTGDDPNCPFGPGNQTGGTGGYAIVNSDCDGQVTDDTEMITSSIDLSAASAAALFFNLDYNDYPIADEFIDVDVSTNGGANWINVYHIGDNLELLGPALAAIDISSVAAGESNVKIRFHYANSFFGFWWAVDNVAVGVPSCNAGSGLGLIVGNVFDANTDDSLAGATVAHAEVGAAPVLSTTTFDVPEDPNQPGGFYIIAGPSPAQALQASAKAYGSVVETPEVEAGTTVRQDFDLPSASLNAAPSPINGVAAPGGADEQTLTIANGGQLDATVEVWELDIPYQPPVTAQLPSSAQLRDILSRIPRHELNAYSTRNIPRMPSLAKNPPAASNAAGNVLAAYPTDLEYGWGISYNTNEDNFWVGNLAAAGGDNLDYQYLASDGSQTGETIDNNSWIAAFAADGAYNSRTGMLWRVNVGGDNCVYELDPVAKAPTGNTICPAFLTSERGLAYDPVTDTYWAGSWNDGVIVHFDGDGNILDGAFVGLEISGLAYNPRTQHLFVAVNTEGPFDLYVVDVHSYEILSAAKIKEGNVRAVTPFGAAGLEADCAGNLWFVEQNLQQIYKIDSEEANWCVNDVPWLTADPSSFSVTSGGGLPVTVGFDATGLKPGLHRAQLTFTNDSPHELSAVPVNFIVRFGDITDLDLFAPYIYGAAGAGMMTGCGGGNFCSGDGVTRSDMAGYIERAIHGAGFLGTPYLGSFTDVSQQTSNANYIQSLVDESITAGCGNGTTYCPNAPNTRAQMAVFIVKAVEGSDFVPPDCTGVFDDVPCPGGFAVNYIEYLFDQGVTAGCGNDNYCPDAAITNGQLAVFLVKAFNIPHL